MLQLKTIRLINFHNFSDETIPVRGHLFLVGDNTSGKSTILDAVQWVLSGGQHWEMNSAASLGGKDDGRTLRGAVARFDQERGALNRGRSITYAALELEDDDGHPLTIGLGAELAHHEAQLQTWGFIFSGPLSDVPLLKGGENGAAGRPAMKDELRKSLGADKVFFQLSRYQKVLAAKFTRSETAFGRLTWFWKVSKAYKQLAHRTRDYSQLLRDLLPDPQGEVFIQVAAGLSALAGIETRLESLRKQRGYLERLSRWVGEVAAHAEAVARYEYLLAYWENERVAKKMHVAESERTAKEQELRKVESEFAKLQAEIASCDAQLQDLRSRDKEGLTGRRISLEAGLQAAERAAQERSRQAAVEGLAIARESKSLLEAQRRLTAALTATAAEAKRLMSQDYAFIGAFAESLLESARSERPQDRFEKLDFTSTAQEAAQISAKLLSARDALRAEIISASSVERETRADSEALERLADPLPRLPRYAECIALLRGRGLRFTPLYQLVEKSGSAEEALFRDLESALGERVLGALVPEPEHAAETAQLVLRDFPEIPVVRTDLPKPTGSHWIEKVVDWARLPEEARAYLVKICGEGAFPGLRLDGGGRTEQTGAAVRVLPRQEPLLGASARKQAHQRRREAAKRALAAAQTHLDALKGQEAKQQNSAAALDAFRSLLAGVREGARGEAARECQNIHRTLDLTRERQRQARREADEKTAEAKCVTAELTAVKESMSAKGLDDLEARVSQVQKRRAAATESRDRADGALQELRKTLALLERDIQEAVETLSDLTTRLGALGDALRSRVAPEFAANLEHYVLEVKQGRRFTDTANITQRQKEEERAKLGAVMSILGDAGVQHAEYGGLFGLSYDEAANRVIDRKGEPLDRLLEGFSAQLAEQESLLSTERRKLFEEVILGELARSLQFQISSLEETVKEVNAQLQTRVFGQKTRYRIRMGIRSEHARFVASLKRLAGFDQSSREEFEAELSERLKALPHDGGPLPPAFDYRHWFEFHLKMTTHTDEGVLLDPRIARLGSGGEQAVPKYLIILAMAAVLFKMSDSKVRVLLFDEAFYGIDQARREELLRLASELDLQLVVASPDQAGDRESYRKATTVFLVKDADNEVHTVVNHFWLDKPLELFKNE